MPSKAKVYIGVTIAAGLALLLVTLVRWESQDPIRCFSYIVLASLASCLKVNLPGIAGTMSVNFLFILIGVVELSLPETIAMGCAGVVFQCIWRSRTRPRPIQILFSVASMAMAVAVCYQVYHLLASGPSSRLPIVLALSGCAFFIANTVQIAAAISLVESRSLGKVWKDCYFWSFPYYLIGAAIAGLLSTLNRFVGWQTSLLVLPIIYWIYRSYRLYLGRLENEKNHATQMAGLHLRTIEALAMAIEAKDCSTHSHVRRVEVYAYEIGKRLGLNEPELEALYAAALLHDIGKLAVPEHILSKPGKLTPMEFEKMKIHPVVGAEILEKVEFPYPVAPLVRAHHEKWDGTGYPNGLRREEIPIGARILSAVDCLDALASDRQYRRALPLEEAMAQVAAEAGKSFDPKVVEVLQEHYHELEQLVAARPLRRSTLSKNLSVERGAAPAAGFEAARRIADKDPFEFLSAIAAARHEAQTLFELTQDLGTSLSLNETLSVFALRLKKMIPYDSICVYVRRESNLVPEYASGENFRVFSSLQIPMGEGLSGWVAENKKPIVNGNPSVESGYLNDQHEFSTLRSALAVPLEGISGVVGVLALYHAGKDYFTNDHLRILMALTEKVALSIENALKYRQAETCATTDALTGLPNARSLFLHLDRELARCQRQGTTLSLLVCDLDGFKQVNDRFGHLEGNKVLREVAQGLKGLCREYDYVARMGGDEFVVVLPGHPSDAVETNTCNRLRDVAEQAGYRLCRDKLISLSVGAAFYPKDGMDAEQLLAEADRRMYKAKQQRSEPPNFRTRHLARETTVVH